MVTTFARITKPSEDKRNNLPEQFRLEEVNGKIIETWRKNHLRPKPKDGEELNLPAAFERRYRTAPIVQDRDLETWFTQAPQT
jgi:hypothetical protein